ncbi:hypothetical protein N665_1266s0007 [Sinapis alba]|nr:hypothetical protein N665_1266s0007 [Sinapis alba]
MRVKQVETSPTVDNSQLQVKEITELGDVGVNGGTLKIPSPVPTSQTPFQLDGVKGTASTSASVVASLSLTLTVTAFSSSAKKLLTLFRFPKQLSDVAFTSRGKFKIAFLPRN